VPEEKKTDVNIAVNLIDDAVKNTTDSMVIVSGDSDIEPAVKWVRDNRPDIRITVYIPSLEPGQNERGTSFYHQIGVTHRDLPLDQIRNHLFPEKVPLANGSHIERPASWVAAN
jgi:hypothetical protein